VIEFGVLGPLTVRREDRPIAIPTAMLQRLLTLLICNAARPLRADAVADALWSGAPPRSAHKTLHVYVHRLRRALGEDGRIVFGPSGYQLTVAPDELDAYTFNRLVSDASAARAQADLVAARAFLQRGLDLWRGPAYPDARDLPAVVTEANRLEEHRLTALEERIRIDLELGAHRDIIGELSAVVAEHPYRESLRECLMLALYWCGRRADALEEFHQVRGLLREQLGVEPGPALQQLYVGILRDEVDDAGPAPRAPILAQAVGQPAQLPRNLPDFIGRGNEVDQIIAAVRSGRPVTISAIGGMAGIGKTTLAVHVAHRLAGGFPDGQLFLDLRAHTAGADPMDSSEALDYLLRSIGVPTQRIPDGLDERAARWRTEAARRRLLLVLDDAAAVEQVRPLLPGTGDCLVLITSRRRLSALDAAAQLFLDLLPASDSAALFCAVAGPRAAADADAVARVVQLCGRLPLAVRIAGARLASRPQWTVADLADRLQRSHRLVELSLEDRSVSSALALSYRHLGPDEQRLFRLLGLHPGRDFDAYAAAALADIRVEKAEALLESLLDLHLVTQRTPGRYLFHRLVCEFARLTVDSEEPTDAIAAALRRLYDYYLQTVDLACDLVEPTRPQVESAVTHPPSSAPPVTEPAQALEWLDVERANLVAAVHHAAAHGWPQHAWQLAHALRVHYALRGGIEDIRATHDDAEAATIHLGDLKAQATIVNNRGTLLMMGGRNVEALEWCQRALTIRREIGDQRGVAGALVNIGGILGSLKRLDEAIACLQEGHDILRELDDSYGRAAALGNIGSTLNDLHRHAEALEYLRTARAICHDVGHRSGEAIVWGMIGDAHQGLGDRAAAIEAQLRAHAICREIGFRYGEAGRLIAVGRLYREQKEASRARECLQEALTIAQHIGDPGHEASAYDGLGHLLSEAGDRDGANEHWRHAVAIFTELDDPRADDIKLHIMYTSETTHRV